MAVAATPQARSAATWCEGLQALIKQLGHIRNLASFPGEPLRHIALSR
ncbi:hypothetical protein [Xanthomonas sp. CFBP 7912]|nr:hypothetical protein [Xanthomonas sp. CFBP 7912]